MFINFTATLWPEQSRTGERLHYRVLDEMLLNSRWDVWYGGQSFYAKSATSPCLGKEVSRVGRSQPIGGTKKLPLCKQELCRDEYRVVIRKLVKAYAGPVLEVKTDGEHGGHSL